MKKKLGDREIHMKEVLIKHNEDEIIRLLAENGDLHTIEKYRANIQLYKKQLQDGWFQNAFKSAFDCNLNWLLAAYEQYIPIFEVCRGSIMISR